MVVSGLGNDDFELSLWVTRVDDAFDIDGTTSWKAEVREWIVEVLFNENFLCWTECGAEKGIAQ